MHNKSLYIFLLALFIFHGEVNSKKSKKIKRPKNDTELTTIQPNVITYSSFGFNDVGAYDGFVPSSPDYISYLNNNYNQEPLTRLYAPAFPSALESADFNNNYDFQSKDEQNINVGASDGQQELPSSSLQSQINPINLFNSFDGNDGQSHNIASDEVYGQNIETEKLKPPVYGAKLNSKNKYKPYNYYNITDFNVYDDGFSNVNNDTNNNFHELRFTQGNKPILQGESGNNYLNSSYRQIYSPTDVDDYVTVSIPNSFSIPKMVDFTNHKKYYPTAIDNKFLSASTAKPPGSYISASNIQHQNIYLNQEDSSNTFKNAKVTFKDTFNLKDVEDIEREEMAPQSHKTRNSDFSTAFYGVTNTNNFLKLNKFNSDNKDKHRNKPWVSSNHSGDLNNWNSPMKGFDFSTNYSRYNFKSNIGVPKKQFNSNSDQVLPASSSINFNHDFPETEYTSFKNIPSVKSHYNNDYYNIPSFDQDINNSGDYISPFKSLYSTVPTTTTHWGNTFKSTDFSSYKNHLRKPQYNDDFVNDVVHIPKRQQSHKYNSVKPLEYAPSDWSSYTKHIRNANRHTNDWNKDVSYTRFKTEEDLLGLRTHDTSHPSYLPTYKPYKGTFSDDNDYNELVEKWKQSYLKSKYKDTYHDYENYASEAKPVHVPIPKPYRIEIPHPVIVPVPQPYPVKVPVPKPVAVPVVRELTVSIEKPVPYPVVKKVPYPIEKPVPVPVEKQVAVPVMKPYPVPVPHVQPVFHHTRTREEYDTDLDAFPEDDDYLPRESEVKFKKNTPYERRPWRSRNRSRKPSRMTYEDRNRRRWPERQPSGFTRQHSRRPNPTAVADSPHSSYKYHNFEVDEYNHEPSDFPTHCKRNGDC